jgi:ABC-type transporter Mla subunit MlaD
VLNLEKAAKSRNEHGEKMEEQHKLLKEILTTLRDQPSLNEISKQVGSILEQGKENSARLEENNTRLERNSARLDGISDQGNKQQSRLDAMLRTIYNNIKEGVRDLATEVQETRGTVSQVLDTVTETKNLTREGSDIVKRLRDMLTI